MTSRFDDYSVAVTGAASGIGRATVEALASAGAHVLAVDRNEGALQQLAGTAISTFAGDVGNDDLMAQVAADMARHAGEGRRLGLVTAAGISNSGTALAEIERETWNKVFEINVTGTWLWLKTLTPVMRDAGGGAVVTIASQLAFAGGRNNAAYIASKGAIVSLTKTAALELAEDAIRVNAVAPGATETPLLRAGMARQKDPHEAEEASRRRHAMKRFGRPGEIASAITFLLSEDASFVTGTTLIADGGWLAA
jgi:NAD(P)-dependent dehydrogenase (short-subunit alcohol dehydrogenase family)